MSTFKSEAIIELEWLGGEDLKIKFNSECMNDLMIKRSNISPEKVGAEARKLLAASLAECLGSTLLFLLKWTRVKLNKFYAVASAITGKDEKGRICVDSINLTIHLNIPKDEETIRKFERVKNLFKRGCLISRSLERGIKVNYSIVTE